MLLCARALDCGSDVVLGRLVGGRKQAQWEVPEVQDYVTQTRNHQGADASLGRGEVVRSAVTGASEYQCRVNCLPTLRLSAPVGSYTR